MLFHNPDLDLKRAVPRTLELTPLPNMVDPASIRDYDAMSGMILGIGRLSRFQRRHSNNLS